MAQAQDTLGKKVVVRSTGEERERVADLILDPAGSEVQGFLLENPALFGSPYYVPMSSVRAIGSDAILVENEEEILQFSEDKEDALYRFASGASSLKGLKLMTEEGKELGSIVDVRFGEDTGMIEGYEVSGGVMADVYSGRSFVPVSQGIRIGKDVAFVPVEVEQELEAQVGGLRAAAGAAGERLDSMREQAGQRYSEVRGEAEQRYMDLKDSAPERTAEMQGQVHRSAEELRDSMNTFWDDVKTRVGEMKDRATLELEQSKIKRALGRPVTRVILDKTDQPILDTGDLITNEAIEKARQNGVLDILLNSVYDKEPELSKEEMKMRHGA